MFYKQNSYFWVYLANRNKYEFYNESLKQVY